MNIMNGAILAGIAAQNAMLRNMANQQAYQHAQMQSAMNHERQLREWVFQIRVQTEEIASTLAGQPEVAFAKLEHIKLWMIYHGVYPEAFREISDMEYCHNLTKCIAALQADAGKAMDIQRIQDCKKIVYDDFINPVNKIIETVKINRKKFLNIDHPKSRPFAEKVGGAIVVTMIFFSGIIFPVFENREPSTLAVWCLKCWGALICFYIAFKIFKRMYWAVRFSHIKGVFAENGIAITRKTRRWEIDDFMDKHQQRLKMLPVVA